MTDEQEKYENLANGIILRAVTDYREAYMAYLRDPFSVEKQAHVDELRAFFPADCYRQLTKVDGYFIRREIEKECEEKRKCEL